MANREENLKKINDELENLSDDELKKVAGGYDVPHTIKRNPSECLGTVISSEATNLDHGGH